MSYKSAKSDGGVKTEMKYLIIGLSAAGVSAIESIRKLDKKSEIVAVTEENYPYIYSRCLLSYYLAGDIPEEKIKYREDNFFKENNVEVIFGKKVEKVVPQRNLVILSSGGTISYDKVLIATGARSKMEEIPGVEQYGVFGLRNIKDAKNIMDIIPKCKEAVILGGGLIGLRAAYALFKRGIKVNVVVKSPHILSQIVAKEEAEIIQSYVVSHGINVLTNLAAKEILSVGGNLIVVLENNEKLSCQLVIIGKGVQPNIELVKDTNVKINYGIVVNEFMRTSVDNIYAGGDVAEYYDITTNEYTINALWPNAVIQGRIAGINMVEGNTKKYEGTLANNSIDFFGLPLISCGITKPKTKEFEILVKKDLRKNVYKKIVLKNNIIVGFILIGKIENAGIYRELIRKQVDISLIKHQILDENFGFSNIVPLINQQKEKFKEKEYQEIII